MAMQNPNSMVTCPLNPVHVLSAKRMQSHIFKCMKTFPTGTFETCPFNATHVIMKDKFSGHIHICPDRGFIESSTIRMGANSNITLPKYEDKAYPVSNTDESWDTDPRFGTYKTNFGIIGKTKSEKKKIHEEKLNEFKKQLEPESLTPPVSHEQPQERDLILPKTQPILKSYAASVIASRSDGSSFRGVGQQEAGILFGMGRGKGFLG